MCVCVLIKQTHFSAFIQPFRSLTILKSKSQFKCIESSQSIHIRSVFNAYYLHRSYTHRHTHANNAPKFSTNNAIWGGFSVIDEARITIRILPQSHTILMKISSFIDDNVKVFLAPCCKLLSNMCFKQT